MGQVRQEVCCLVDHVREAYAVDEARVEREAETRWMCLPRGQRSRLNADRVRSSRSFFGTLSLSSRRARVYHIEDNQNTVQIILPPALLICEMDNDMIAVVLDDAGFHYPKTVTDLYEPGQALYRIRPIYLPV